VHHQNAEYKELLLQIARSDTPRCQMLHEYYARSTRMSFPPLLRERPTGRFRLPIEDSDHYFLGISGQTNPFIDAISVESTHFDWVFVARCPRLIPCQKIFKSGS
jgi:hypothetical protein